MQVRVLKKTCLCTWGAGKGVKRVAEIFECGTVLEKELKSESISNRRPLINTACPSPHLAWAFVVGPFGSHVSTARGLESCSAVGLRSGQRCFRTQLRRDIDRDFAA